MRAISAALILAGAVCAQQNPVVAGLDRFHRGEYTAAKQDFAEALARGDDPRARVYLALSRAATGECDKVLAELGREFEQLSEKSLQRAAGLGLAQCAVSNDRFDVALPALRVLAEKFPDDADVLYLTARLHMKAWNDTLYRMFQKTPASFRVNQISGEVFEMQGRFSEAAVEFRKAIEKNPSALNLHFRLGRALLLESRTTEALAAARKEFEAELKLNPSDAAAEYQIGQILIAQQRPAEAALRYQRALALDASFLEAMIALGKLRGDEKRYSEAIALLERAVMQTPQSEAARYNLMMVYRNAGRAEDAQRQKAELEKLRQPPAGEFTEFLKKLGEKTPRQ
jgi:tetratricopeptide (TPR) repeat protein